MGNATREVKKDQWPSKPASKKGIFNTHGDPGPYPLKGAQKKAVAVSPQKLGGKVTLTR